MKITCRLDTELTWLFEDDYNWEIGGDYLAVIINNYPDTTFFLVSL